MTSNFTDLYSSPSIIKKNEMGGTCGMYEEEERFTGFGAAT
jgi:hypothetical protein